MPPQAKVGLDNRDYSSTIAAIFVVGKQRAGDQTTRSKAYSFDLCSAAEWCNNSCDDILACKEFRAMAVKSSPSEPILANLEGLLTELETIYKDIYSHPELSMQE